MKTFDEEYNALVKWYFSQREKIEQESPVWEGGLDGQHTAMVRELTNDYRRKLKKLRETYGKQ